MITQKIIDGFLTGKNYDNPAMSQGACDVASIDFLNCVKNKLGIDGIVIDVAEPKIEPDLGYKYWGGKEQICHYISFFPSLNLAYDFTARQFWGNVPVPLIMTKEQLAERWDDIDWNDARPELEHLYFYDQ